MHHNVQKQKPKGNGGCGAAEQVCLPTMGRWTCQSTRGICAYMHIHKVLPAWSLWCLIQRLSTHCLPQDQNGDGSVPHPPFLALALRTSLRDPGLAGPFSSRPSQILLMSAAGSAALLWETGTEPSRGVCLFLRAQLGGKNGKKRDKKDRNMKKGEKRDNKEKERKKKGKIGGREKDRKK